MKNPINTIAALDVIQSNLNPAHLDRMPRPHDLLASDIASNVADATRALRDRLDKLPQRRKDYCDIRDDADNAIRGAVSAMVAIALDPDLQ